MEKSEEQRAEQKLNVKNSAAAVCGFTVLPFWVNSAVASSNMQSGDVGLHKSAPGGRKSSVTPNLPPKWIDGDKSLDDVFMVESGRCNNVWMIMGWL